jgi:hypothetical protein
MWVPAIAGAGNSGLLFICQRGSYWHLGCFMEIMKPLIPFLPLAFGLFSPLILTANRALSPGDSDSVTGTAIMPGPIPQFVLTTRHQLSVAVPLAPRFFENRLNGRIGLKQSVA